MYKVITTKLFEGTLDKITSYLIQTYSSKIAENYLEELRQQIQNLALFPYMWPENQMPEFSNHRILISRKNIVFYRVDEEKKIVICEIITSSDQNYLNLK